MQNAIAPQLFEHERRVLDTIRDTPKTIAEITREIFAADSIQYNTGIGTGIVVNALQGLDEAGMLRHTKKNRNHAFMAA